MGDVPRAISFGLIQPDKVKTWPEIAPCFASRVSWSPAAGTSTLYGPHVVANAGAVASASKAQPASAAVKVRAINSSCMATLGVAPPPDSNDRGMNYAAEYRRLIIFDLFKAHCCDSRKSLSRRLQDIGAGQQAILKRQNGGAHGGGVNGSRRSRETRQGNWTLVGFEVPVKGIA